MAWTQIPTYNHPEIFSASSHFITPELDPKNDKTVCKTSFQNPLKIYQIVFGLARTVLPLPNAFSSLFTL